jgi:16S rRNA (adenine1518-N6/adenine1519-N6)-dimethyltransferase
VKRFLGQHFLFDKGILRKIIDCSGLTANDTVVEIGPGYGTLSKLLAQHVKKVVAIEIDRKLVVKLKDSLSTSPNVEIIAANALKFPYETIEGKFRVIANIPYYITTPLLFRLFEFKEKILSMTLLLQKEVAKRIVATPGSKDYGILSISVQLYTRPELKFLVPKDVFSPPPEVESAVVHFEVYPRPLYKLKNEEFFLKVVKTAFSQRRKTISNSLKPFKDIKEALLEAGIDPRVRPEVLSIRDFIKLSDALQE